MSLPMEILETDVLSIANRTIPRPTVVDVEIGKILVFNDIEISFNYDVDDDTIYVSMMLTPTRVDNSDLIESLTNKLTRLGYEGISKDKREHAFAKDLQEIKIEKALLEMGNMTANMANDFQE